MVSFSSADDGQHQGGYASNQVVEKETQVERGPCEDVRFKVLSVMASQRSKCKLQEKVDLFHGMAVDFSAFRNPAIAELKALSCSVSIADPQLPDCPLIAVSDGFCRLTGLEREMVLGRNCRFLNQGCENSPSTKLGLRLAVETGKRFSASLSNRRCDGTLFTNFLDLRGLKVGRTASGEEKYLLIGIQTDVTEFCEDSGEIPVHHQKNMAKVAQMICKNITPNLLKSSVGGAWADIVEAYSKPRWVEGETVVEQI